MNARRAATIVGFISACIAGGVSPLAASPSAAITRQSHPAQQNLFEDDFETGVDGWSFPFGQGQELVDAGGGRGTALELRVIDEPVYALIEGSDQWDGVRIEGDVMFPEDVHNYLGFIYRYVDDRRRIDFGSLYIKGNGGYIQANIHHDTNVGRTWHPEVRTNLEGAGSIQIGQWKRFALEVVDELAHLYVGDFDTPAMTLRSNVATAGGFGFKPRNPGGAVRIDNIRVSAIRSLTYRGAPIPDPAYRRADWATEWSVLGPLSAHAEEVEGSAPTDLEGTVAEGTDQIRWRALDSDHRGAVSTGAVTEFRGGRRVAYFHTAVTSEGRNEVDLVLSTVDDLAIWVNGTFTGFVDRQPAAWWDASRNAARAPRRLRAVLQEGRNDVLVRVVGGVYASGGFYLTVAAVP